MSSPHLANQYARPSYSKTTQRQIAPEEPLWNHTPETLIVTLLDLLIKRVVKEDRARQVQQPRSPRIPASSRVPSQALPVTSFELEELLPQSTKASTQWNKLQNEDKITLNQVSTPSHCRKRSSR